MQTRVKSLPLCAKGVRKLYVKLYYWENQVGFPGVFFSTFALPSINLSRRSIEVNTRLCSHGKPAGDPCYFERKLDRKHGRMMGCVVRLEAKRQKAFT